MICDNPKIIYQGVDTLVTSHKSDDLADYNALFVPFLRALEKLKTMAQAVDGFDKKSRFVIHEFPVLGKTKVYAQGAKRYSYHLENEDVYIEISEASFESDTPHIRVRYSNHFLFLFQVQKAYDTVISFVSLVLGSSKNILSEIHLCCDVASVIYEHDDKLRFQSRFSVRDFEEMSTFTAYNRFKGVYFGKDTFLFRIYDKLIDLRHHPEHSFIKYAWYLNGYSESDTNIVKKSVFRHEIQYRRSYLKQYISDVSDEPLFIFQNLDKLWFHALEKVSFVNLTDNEIFRIKSSVNHDSVIKIFQRAKDDKNRFDFWSTLHSWLNNLSSGSLDMYPAFKEAKLSTLRKKIKEVVSLAARLGLTPTDLKNLVAETDAKMQEFEGITLEQYGKLKVMDSFAHNERLAARFSIEAPKNMVLVRHTYDDLTQAFVNFDVLSKRKELRSAEKFLGDISNVEVSL